MTNLEILYDFARRYPWLDGEKSQMTSVGLAVWGEDYYQGIYVGHDDSVYTYDQDSAHHSRVTSGMVHCLDELQLSHVKTFPGGEVSVSTKIKDETVWISWGVVTLPTNEPWRVFGSDADDYRVARELPDYELSPEQRGLFNLFMSGEMPPEEFRDLLLDMGVPV